MLAEREEQIRQSLLASLQRLQAELAALEALERGQAGAAAPQYGKRSGDHIAEALDHRRNVIAGQTLRRQAEAIEQALAKLAEGTYGRCERCGGPIGEERLEALPWATLCIACKRREERPRR